MKEEIFHCKKCNKIIDGHHQYCHDGMCEECFNETYFPEEKPENDPFNIMNSKGKCRLCNKEFSGRSIKKHLNKCAVKGEDALLLKASAGPFWVYFTVPKNFKLKDIDQFLRDLWLECCGHLSSFKINDVYYMSDGQTLEHDEKSMNIRVEEVLKEGLKLTHEYDFGTTTELGIEVIAKTSAEKIEILARNDLPTFKCESCKKPAEVVCVQCIWEGNGFFCRKCAKKHECEEPHFLPVVNSPRIGMCGFTGKNCREP